MSTNQTIDGVPREKLEAAVHCILHGTDTLKEADDLAEELRALLDKTDADIPASTPQGEPLAWTEFDVLDFMSVALRHAEYSGLAPSDISDGLRYMAEKGRPALCAEQRAPVVRCSFCDASGQDGNPWTGHHESVDGKSIYRVMGCKDHAHLVDALRGADSFPVPS